jgi:hypothetical protein
MEMALTSTELPCEMVRPEVVLTIAAITHLNPTVTLDITAANLWMERVLLLDTVSGPELLRYNAPP